MSDEAQKVFGVPWKYAKCHGLQMSDEAQKVFGVPWKYAKCHGQVQDQFFSEMSGKFAGNQLRNMSNMGSKCSAEY